MVDKNALLSSVGAAPDPSKEGLPFWIFWLLLCIILLLLFFIFLRDKDLRRRLSAFLSGARRRMIRMRLAARIRREKQKKAGLWRELGQTAWSEDVRVEGTEETFRSLSAVEKEMNRRQAEWQQAYDRIEALETAREEARKARRTVLEAKEAELRTQEERLKGLTGREKELGKMRPGPGEGSAPAEAGEEAIRVAADIAIVRDEIAVLREKVRDLRRIQSEADRAEEREIREWIENKEGVQNLIIEAKKAAEPLTESLGRALDEARVEHKDLALLYFQIDSVDRTIRDLQARIEKLS